MQSRLLLSIALAASPALSLAQGVIPGQAIASVQAPLQCENASRRLLSIAKLEGGGRVGMLFHDGKWLQMNGIGQPGVEQRFEDRATGFQLSTAGREVVLEKDGAVVLKCISVRPLELP